MTQNLVSHEELRHNCTAIPLIFHILLARNKTFITRWDAILYSALISAR